MENFRKKIFPIATLILLVVVLIISSVVVYRQITLRSKASGSGVTLSLAAPTSAITAGSNFDVVVNLASSDTTNWITAASMSATYDSTKLTLVSVTPGTLFTQSYVAGSREALSIGTTCSSVSDCKTTASGVACTNSLCTNSAFTTNILGSARFWIGVPCDVTHMGCLSNACAVLAGSGSDTCTTDTECANNAGSGTKGTCYPLKNTSAGQVATIRFLVKSTAPSGNTEIKIDSGNSTVTALDSATGNAISNSVLSGVTGATVAITGAADTTAPTVSLTAPAAGNVSGSVTVSANATDNVGVTKVDFYAGTTLIGTDTGSPYGVTWNTTSIANGSYTLTAKATDAANNVGTSANVNVTVNNTVAAPTLTFRFKLLQNSATVARTADVILKTGTTTLSFPGVALSFVSSNVFQPATPISLTGATAGTSYSVLVKVPGYLRKNLGTIALVAGANTAPTAWSNTYLLSGDFDGNNIINAMDVGNMLGLYTQLSVPVTTATQTYDLDGNNVVNAMDVANTLANYTALSVPGDN